MIVDIDKNVLITIVFIVLFSVILYIKKPDLMFDSSGEFKQFGTGKDQTLYPVFLVILIPSIILYVLLVTKNNEFV